MKLAAVTAYFNPCNSQSRWQNFVKFAECIHAQNIDLHVIEGIYTGNADTQPIATTVNLANLACQLCTSSMCISYTDLLFHKERFLNILINSLPKAYDAVLWIDADIIFTNNNLQTEILTALETYPLIQPWSHCTMLNQHGQPQDWFGKGSAIKSTAWHNFKREPKFKNGSPLWSHPGFAWAIRRDIFKEMQGLYEYHITGCGDSLMSMGWFGDFTSNYFYGRMNPAMSKHWLKWAVNAHRLIQGNIGCFDTEITHLYHGSIADRRYTMRWKMLATLGYDPEKHLEDPGPNLALKWSETARQENKNLVKWVEDYIGGRKEDE